MSFWKKKEPVVSESEAKLTIPPEPKKQPTVVKQKPVNQKGQDVFVSDTEDDFISNGDLEPPMEVEIDLGNPQYEEFAIPPAPAQKGNPAKHSSNVNKDSFASSTPVAKGKEPFPVRTVDQKVKDPYVSKPIDPKPKDPYAPKPIGPGSKDPYYYGTGFSEPYVPKPYYEKKSAIIFVLENTPETNNYSKDIFRLINKIIVDNTSEVFMFLRIGNQPKYSGLLDVTQIKANKIPDDLLQLDDILPMNINLADALKHIQAFVRDNLTYFKTILINNKRYSIEEARIIFIGTGKSNSAAEDCSSRLSTLFASKKIKTIKYFCIKDEDAINAAAIGFPIIGHIESNFYQ